jgi:hypothetical protein
MSDQPKTKTDRPTKKANIIIGYRTRPVAPERLEKLIPEFLPAANLTDEKKIKADVDNKRARYMENAGRMPITSTFDMVCLCDPANKAFKTWKYEGREPGSGKKPVCLAVLDYLLSKYPKAWSNDISDISRSPVTFIAFEPKRFLKILGIECCLPSTEGHRPPPVKLWYSNSDHREIETLVPDDFCKGLPFRLGVQAYRPVEPKAAEKWDKLFEGWTGPHIDPVKDCAIATELSRTVGFLSN